MKPNPLERAFDYPRPVDRTREAWDEDEYAAWERHELRTYVLAAFTIISAFTLAVLVFAYVILKSI